jgi:predicted ABC-type transport system involved in lysophospholipase L1 biosynthesis ATPase subunit
MTLLVVTHEKRMSRAASRVLVLRAGVLAEDPALEGSA